ncbi:aminotransferase class IV [Flavobacterium cheniae]|uniref:branched-chain-amino-acid transaminase n=1 Tax=Flavobacterium cheniae TaxID=295428 RepID=A0A562KBV8_9FLAO|nr:aminotransferase class IV [Flavobacterium cheniae]TDR18618.1 branched-chain amino acid aminotransferase [Flavobacterium cheniae]TWH92900.1 branched-chain amino acid aminotransferase [Flavobacterium cheniae]
MVNCNGNIQENSAILIDSNRGFLFGDSVFETIKVLDNKVLFLEDHYFRLMASMRICRMEIPMNFTMEYFEEQILKLIATFSDSNSYRVRFSVYRDSDGFYLPKTRNVQFIVAASSLNSDLYAIDKESYEVELYKDFYVSKQLLSTLKTNNKMLQITGSIFADENGYDNCLVLNDEKNVVEALQSNLFMKTGNVVVTPPVSDGCLNGIMRKQILELLKKIEGIEVKEASISPFDLQKADELFLTNVISGIQPITKYRKKEYTAEFASDVLKRLNAKIRLS